jgi:hypothetical protein
MNEMTCIKSVKTSKGNEFIKGNKYYYILTGRGAKVFYDSDNSINIKSIEQLNKFFIIN